MANQKKCPNRVVMSNIYYNVDFQENRNICTSRTEFDEGIILCQFVGKEEQCPKYLETRKDR